MDPLLAFVAPLAALLLGVGGVDTPSDLPVLDAAPASEEAGLAPRPAVAEALAQDLGWVPVTERFQSPMQDQVRIERSITIRISPRLPRQPDFAELPERIEPPRLVERSMAKCVPIRGISGVEVSRDNRLLLFMRDQRIVSLGLEKSCRARDFYAGFYIERPSDGQICVDRDRLQSRSGANCALTRMRQLIEE